MFLRMPVLDSFNWQKEILGVLESETDIQDPVKGSRYIILNKDHQHHTHIIWYDGEVWKFDIPKIGWTLPLILQDNHFEILQFTGETWEYLGADKIYVDSSNLGKRIPKHNPDTGDEAIHRPWTVQTLIDWLNLNLNENKLNLPTGDCFADGVFNWEESTNVTDALNNINYALADLAPSKPESLDNKELEINTDFYSGKIAADIQDGDNSWYVNGYVAGSVLRDNIVTGDAIKLGSPEPEYCFSYADLGLLNVYHKKGNETEYTKEAIYDLGHSYIQPPCPAKRLPKQDLTKYNGLNKNCSCFANGALALPTIEDKNSVLYFNGNDAKLIITDISTFNKFSLWQLGNVELEYCNLQSGYHCFKLEHDFQNTMPIDSTLGTDLFYENDQTDISLTSDPNDLFTIVDDSNTVQISGITYLTDKTKCKIKFDIDNAITNVYSSSDLININLYNDIIIINTQDLQNLNNGIPTANSQINVDHEFTLTTVGSYDVLNSNVTVYHPYKEFNQDLELCNKILYKNTISKSTPYFEDFRNEKYRLKQAEDFSTIIQEDTWDSTLDLSLTDDAPIYLDQLYRRTPLITGYYPTSNAVSYDNKNGKQYYIRKFYSTTKTPYNSITFTLNGQNINPLEYCSTINSNTGYHFEIRLPGVTEWLDASIPFDDSIFNPMTSGCGCRNIGKTSENTLSCTFGTISSAASEYTIYIRITLTNDDTTFDSILIDWE